MSTVTVDFDVARTVFDLVANSTDFEEGFHDRSEIDALRTFAGTLGVDPILATPRECRGWYYRLVKTSDLTAGMVVWARCEQQRTHVWQTVVEVTGQPAADPVWTWWLVTLADACGEGTMGQNDRATWTTREPSPS